MNKIWIMTIGFLIILGFGIHHAAAFSTDSRSSQNTDGSPKFADPDEQRPDFMVTPDGDTATNESFSFGVSSATPVQFGDTTPGAQAFDQAYAHQQNKQ